MFKSRAIEKLEMHLELLKIIYFFFSGGCPVFRDKIPGSLQGV